MLKVKLFLLSIVLAFAISPVFAQDAPTDVPPTQEVTITATAPAPIETPAPIDTQSIPSWAFVIVLVLAAGIVSVAYVGIVQAAKGAPEWTRALLIAGAHSGLDSLDTFAHTTDTTLDDVAVAELRKRLSDLEAAMKVQQQTSVVQSQKVEAIAAKVG